MNNIQPFTDFPAPRNDPLDYPGKRPETSFVLAKGLVQPITFDEKEKESRGSTYAGQILTPEGVKNIETYLKNQGVAPLSERFAVIGFGSNPVPGQLVSKYDENTIVPVLFGGLEGAEIVWNLISNRGYAFADMIPVGQEGVSGNVGVTFLDESQLKKMVDDEENYHIAFTPGNVNLESGEVLHGGTQSASYFFAGFREIWVPPGYDSAVAITDLPSQGRILPELTQEQTLQLIIDSYGNQLHFKEKDILTTRELAEYIISQKDMPEEPNKLKYDLQQIVRDDPNSLPSVASQVTVVDENTPKPFSYN